MRESTAASITRRLLKAVTQAADALARGTNALAEAVLGGAMPSPQPVPVRVRARRS